MKKFRAIFFYIPKGWEGVKYCLRHPSAGAISLFSWSRIIHCEIWTPDDLTEYYRGSDHGLVGYKVDVATQFAKGRCWTSTLRDSYDGACVRPAAEVLQNPERWGCKTFKATDENYANMVKALDETVKENKGYDKKLIAMMALGIKTAFCPKQLICNESVRVAFLAVKEVTVPYPPNSDMVRHGTLSSAPYWYDEIYPTPKTLKPAELAKALPGAIKTLIETKEA